MKLLDLFEARRLDDPNIEYKEKMVKGQIDRVTAFLKAKPSEHATKLAQTYFEIEELSEKLDLMRKEQNVHIKEVSESFFDAEDSVLTRVIQSIKFVMTFSKQIEHPAREENIVDYEAVFIELNEMMPDLRDMLDELAKKYTTVKNIKAKTTPTRLSVKKVPTVESVEDNRLQNALKRFFALFNKKLSIFDSKFENLKNETF